MTQQQAIEAVRRLFPSALPFEDVDHAGRVWVGFMQPIQSTLGSHIVLALELRWADAVGRIESYRRK